MVALFFIGGLACGAQDDPREQEHGAVASAPLNVLFLIVDDLRPALGCYGDVAITPHMDALAARGTLFERAFCQQSLCNPSRTSVLTGYRPLKTGVSLQKTPLNAQRQRFRPALREIVTLPQRFKNAGYRTLALGKVHHGYGNLDDAASWSEKCWRPPFEFYHSGQWNDREAEKAPAWEAPEVDDHETMDGRIAVRAMELLEEMRDEPFFLAVGFHKPHLPFVAPKAYWDLYDGEAFAAAPSRSAPKNAPDCAVADRRELRGFADIPDSGPLPEAMARRLRQGYYACVSYADALVGEVLATLDRLELTDRTIVCLWGDHGYHLEDNSLWAKQTNFEVAMRAPLIISAPGALPRGKKTNGLVELVDIFPTLCELAGLSLPDAPEEVGGLGGTSLVPLMENPERSWKEAVFGRVGVDNPDPEAGPRQGVGVTVRDDRYRMVEWRLPWREGKPHHYELYDLELDPHATVNLADDKDYKAALQHMRSLQRTGWRGIRRKLLAKKN
jgi:iduronate 2-sulfatase